MNEEEKREIEETAETEAAEKVKETVAAADEKAEETVEETTEAVEVAEETAAEAVTEVAEEAEAGVESAEDEAENPVGYSTDEVTDTPKKLSKGAIGVIVAVAVVIVAIAVAANLFFMGGKSKKGSSYNGDYLDIDGTTAAEIADQQGMEYADFLEMYGLPEDLPGETNGNATENLIPLGTYVELMGSDMDTIREQMGWDETFTEETTLGEARDRTPLSQLVGEESLDQFKEMYELDDSVNGDTLFAEVRHQVELKEKEMYEEQKAAEEEEAASEEDEETDEAEATDDKAEESSDKD